MTNFVALVDGDEVRRTSFMKEVLNRIAPVDGLDVFSCSNGDLCIAWAADPRAPISRASDEQEIFIVWGEPLDDSGRRADASEVRRRWTGTSINRSTPFDGYYAALGTGKRGSQFVAGADILGAFPVYYYADPEVLLVGSSPELFRYHGRFRMELDPEGLVSILLTNNIFEGRTLVRGVRRLEPGHALTWDRSSGARELLQYEIPSMQSHPDKPFSDHVRLLGDAVEDAVSRHASGGPCALMLSGGMDSRMLGGFLRATQSNATALTLGKSWDIEVRCAAQVARALGFDHYVTELDTTQYARYAMLQSTWEHNATGFNTIHQWGVYPLVRELPARLMTGYLVDANLGMSNVAWAFSEDLSESSFDRFFSRVNQFGIAPRILQNLLRPDFGDVVAGLIERMRAVFESYGDDDAQRAWRWARHNRQRFHIGGILWRLTFGAWPVVPVLDRALLETCGSLPAASMMKRKAEEALLQQRFPEFASISIDRNSYYRASLSPGKYLRRLQPLIRNAAGRRQALNTRFPNLVPERRRYFRLYQLNGRAWRRVRLLAEPYKGLTAEFFDPDVLEGLLPPPPARIGSGIGLKDISGPKCLLGFLLWAGGHMEENRVLAP
jgi:asparagine synthase (glutamine-hydrolysing)